MPILRALILIPAVAALSSILLAQTPLESGVAQPFQTDPQTAGTFLNGERGFTFHVPDNAYRVTVRMRRWRGASNVDLYLRPGSDLLSPDDASIALVDPTPDKEARLGREVRGDLTPGAWSVALGVDAGSDAVQGTIEAIIQTTDPVAGEATSVPGPVNLWLAGVADGGTAGSDIAPAHAPTAIAADLRAGAALRFSAEGAIERSGTTYPPEGDESSVVSFSGENGISGIIAPRRGLVGVFLGPGAPAGEPVERFDFSGDGLNASYVRPALHQPFFIGNGYTQDGSPRAFRIPEGATRVFVAPLTRPSAGNSGAFSVRAQVVDLAPAAATNPVHVSGRSDLWLAEESIPLGSPARADVELVAGEALQIFGFGEVVVNRESFPADGGDSRSLGAAVSIAGLVAPRYGLAGVFLSDDAPVGNPPERLNFSTGLEGAERIEPLIAQPFFVGSGRTGAGVIRNFIVPAGATRLYLGPVSRGERTNAGAFFAVVSRVVEGRPSTTAEAVTNAGGFGPAPLASGAVMSLFGEGFGALVGATSVPLPTALSDTTVYFDRRPAALFFVSPGQINAQIPWALGTARSAQLTVIREGLASVPVEVALEPYRPGVFTVAGAGPVVINNRTGRLVTAEEHAIAGDALIVFTTGGGPVTSRPHTGAASPGGPLATATIQPTAILTGAVGEVHVTPFFAGLAPGFVGVYQINLIVPEGLGVGEASLRIEAAGFAASNPVTIYLE